MAAVKSNLQKSFHFALVVFLAASIRLFFMYSPAKNFFKERIELNTPLTSWNRGIKLSEQLSSTHLTC